MLGDSIDVKTDERRYNQLISQGMLPSAVIKKIETEKRLGIGIKPKGDTDWNLTAVKVVTISLGLLIGYWIIKRYIKPALTTSQMTSQTSTVGLHALSDIPITIPNTIDDLSGIDTNALYICRQNGLM